MAKVDGLRAAFMATPLPIFGRALTHLKRCPLCSVAAPNLPLAWAPNSSFARADGGMLEYWAVYVCASCGGLITAKGPPDSENANGTPIVAVYPVGRNVAPELPEVARRFLTQAIETLHAPDAAALMAGSAVDNMLKELGFNDGSLYHRIDRAKSDGILTEGMAQWAHNVRLGANRPRHADSERPHVSPEEARQSVDFAEALGQFLFVLTAKVDRGIKEAEKIASQQTD